MIYDTFMFFNENDTLAIRLEELYPVIDKFVIVQSDRTFRGVPKPDYFDYERFERYMDKVELINFNDPTQYASPWEREVAQRNFAQEYLSVMRPDDILIISDCDEIPRRDIVAMLDPVVPTNLELTLFTYRINLACGYHTIKVLYARDIPGKTLEQHRRTPPQVVVPNAGWEFSSLGSPEHVLEKFRAFSHAEFDHLDLDHFTRQMSNGDDLCGWGDEYKPVVVEIDDTWPEAIKNDREYWRKFEW